MRRPSACGALRPGVYRITFAENIATEVDKMTSLVAGLHVGTR
ncbi:hypothetical protein [Sphingomonas sp.]